MAFTWFDRIAAWAARGGSDGEVERRLRNGFQTFFKSGGEIPLERCLGLPARDAALAYRLAERDFHLRRAALLLAGPDGTPSSTALADACNRFMNVVWPCWKTLAQPPTGCSLVHTALFVAAHLGNGRLPESSRQAARIINPMLMCGNPAVLWAGERFSVFERDVRRVWLESEALRIEFEGSFARFRAWRRADAEGLVRFGCAADIFSDSDAEQGDLACENTLTGENP